MQLIVLDKDFNTLGAVSVFTTLLWSRRYTSLGAFELYTTKDYFELLSSGRYLYRQDAEELGVIDEVNYSQDDKGKREVYAKGNFAEVLLAQRVIANRTILSDTLENVMRSLVSANAISPPLADRKIENLVLGSPAGISNTFSMQITGDNLSDALYKIGNAYGISHRLRFNYQTNQLAFEVWQGKDRRDSQNVNSWAIFSNDFYNIRNVTYNRCDSDYKNYAYVAGEGEGTARVVVEVDIRSGKEERRELYVDARDLRSEDESGKKIADAKYREMLINRGKNKLAEYAKAQSVTSGIDPHANLVYKKDFDLGDYCTYINSEIGIASEQRITEILETYEGGKKEIQVTFGNEGTTSIKQLLKRGS